MMNRTNWLYGTLALTGGLIGGILALEISPTVAMAAKQARSIRAQQFVLTDRDGTQRGVMEVTTRGTADLALLDGSGRDRAEMRVAKDGNGGIAFYDQDGRRRVVVGEAVSGRNGIAIYASTGRQIATLSVASSDEASLTLYDPNNGRARAGLGTRPTVLPHSCCSTTKARSVGTTYRRQGYSGNRAGGRDRQDYRWDAGTRT